MKLLRFHQFSLESSLITTLSPCMMCTGTILQFHIPCVVGGDTVNSEGNAEWLRSMGVEVIIFDDPDCIALVKKFCEEKLDLWLEDWGGDASPIRRGQYE